MSRSYKHTPYCGLKKDKFFKNYANRKLRRRKLDHDLQHRSYKKDFCSWEICDYYEIETKNFEEYYLDDMSNITRRQSIVNLPKISIDENNKEIKDEIKLKHSKSLTINDFLYNEIK